MVNYLYFGILNVSLQSFAALLVLNVSVAHVHHYKVIKNLLQLYSLGILVLEEGRKGRKKVFGVVLLRVWLLSALCWADLLHACLTSRS